MEIKMGKLIMVVIKLRNKGRIKLDYKIVTLL